MRSISRVLRSLTWIISATAIYAPAMNANAVPVIPGFNVDVYASVTDPMRLTFAPDGTMFVARDNSGSGGTGSSAAKIHRVAPGGGSVTEYGDVAIVDPDTVLFDATGAISGTAGSVLVGSDVGSSGRISAVLPDETVVTVFGPAFPIDNPHEMLFDSTGRLLIAEISDTSPRVLSSSGSHPTSLYSLPGAPERPLDMAVDSSDRIYTRGPSDSIIVHDASGVLLDPSFSSVPTGVPTPSPQDVGLDFGAGGVWGNDLFAAAEGGEIWRIDSLGNATVFATGFNDIRDLRFGVDGALYVSEFGEDRVLRLSAVPEPSTYALAAFGLIGLGLLAYRRFR